MKFLLTMLVVSQLLGNAHASQQVGSYCQVQTDSSGGPDQADDIDNAIEPNADNDILEIHVPPPPSDENRMVRYDPSQYDRLLLPNSVKFLDDAQRLLIQGDMKHAAAIPGATSKCFTCAGILPDGWEKVISPQGRPYYWNTESDAHIAQWERPRSTCETCNGTGEILPSAASNLIGQRLIEAPPAQPESDGSDLEARSDTSEDRLFSVDPPAPNFGSEVSVNDDVLLEVDLQAETVAFVSPGDIELQPMGASKEVRFSEHKQDLTRQSESDLEAGSDHSKDRMAAAAVKEEKSWLRFLRGRNLIKVVAALSGLTGLGYGLKDYFHLKTELNDANKVIADREYVILGYQTGWEHAPQPYEDNYAGEKDPQGRNHGHGILTYGRNTDKNAKRGVASGDVYTGNWKHGKRDGQGVLAAYIAWDGEVGRHVGALSYDGSWKDDKHHGYGEEHYSDYPPSCYHDKDAENINWECDRVTEHVTTKKCLKKSIPGGLCKIWHAPELRYKGDHNNGFREGKGEEHYEDGSVYKGEFHRNLRHGQGTMAMANGDQYIGEWKKGEHVSGKGTLFYGSDVMSRLAPSDRRAPNTNAGRRLSALLREINL